MDISQTERRELEIFDLILTRGPITVYSAMKESEKSLPTIHRHFKHMEKEGEIAIYREEPHQSGNPKKLYGPTVMGILEFCLFPSIRKKFDSIFEKWINEKPFLKDMKYVFGYQEDFIKQNPREVIQNCKKYMRFFIDAYDLVDDEEFLDENIIDVGWLLLGKKNPKKYYETTKELYEKIPSFRTNLDAMFIGMFAIFAAIHGRKDIEKMLYQSLDTQVKPEKTAIKKPVL